MSERLDSRAVEIFQPSDAAAVGWDILTRIREHPDLGMLSVPHPLTGIPGQYWDPLDLDHGDLGVALVFAAADELRPHDGWDHAALPYISRATDALASRVTTHGTAVMGLFGGAACVAYALRALSRSGKRYRNAVTQVDNLMLDLIETHLAAVRSRGWEPMTTTSSVASLGPHACCFRSPESRTVAPESSPQPWIAWHDGL